MVRRMGIQADGGKRRKVGKSRFGGGSSSARAMCPARLHELLHGMSEEVQATFKRNMGPHGGDDVSSIEGDNPGGLRVVDSAETQCLVHYYFYASYLAVTLPVSGCCLRSTGWIFREILVCSFCRNSWFDSGYILCISTWSWTNFTFFHGAVDSNPVA